MALVESLVGNWELLGRLLAAAGLGAVIGLDRDLHGRAAGLRTHALVSVGSAVFTVLSLLVAGALRADGTAGVPGYDPGRIAAQIVTGIGFLGAGTIMKSSLSISGLTTASCLWLVAAVGMSCGMGMYGLAVASTLLALLFLVGVGQLERYLPRTRSHRLSVELRGREAVDAVRELVRGSGFPVMGGSVSYDYEAGVSKLCFSLSVREVAGDEKPGVPLLARLDAAGLPLLRVEWGPGAESCPS